MSIVEKFNKQGEFIGDEAELIRASHPELRLEGQSPEWIAGYIRAMEDAAINIAEILRPSDDVCGRRQTPHMVRTNLDKLWNHNKSFLENMCLERKLFSSDEEPSSP